MNGNAVQEASVHQHIVTDNYNRHTERQHRQSVQGEESEFSQGRGTPQEIETPQSTSQLNAKTEAEPNTPAKREISPLFVATCTLVATMIGVGIAIITVVVAMNMSLQAQIEGVRTDLREVESSLRAEVQEVRADVREVEASLRTEIQFVYEEVQRVDSRVDAIYLYLIENNPTTQ